MEITIRKFEERDIENKVRWINDSQNNKYLHYDIPLSIQKTEIWYENNRNRTDRYDAVIEVNGIAVGLIGLLSIDSKNCKAEYYVTIGDRNYLGMGVASKASQLLLKFAFEELGLNRVYLYTEVDNYPAVKSYERIGFKREGVLKADVFSRGRYVDRYVYGITKKDFNNYKSTLIHEIDYIKNNSLYMKREDLVPFSFGGNKARKAQLFFEEIDRGLNDCVVTYGSSSSNHCRVVANMAVKRKMKCVIISPEEASKKTYNSKMMQKFGAEIIICPVSDVHDSIERKMQELRKEGYSPYFIPGGGHGNIGTQAYVDCYEEIREYERDKNIHFDYIFLASGTGTTQAGLVCGQLINRENRKIVGISIARKNPRGRDVILDSIKEYLDEQKVDVSESLIDESTIFLDEYINGGYGNTSCETAEIIDMSMRCYGIPLDATYTGKAFAGMMAYISQNNIENCKILFIHTGGTPLFFESLKDV